MARIQLVLANEYILWQIFIFRKLVWLKWEHIYSILHYSSPALEIKDAKFQLRPEKWYKVDYLITDAKTDYKMEFMSQYLNYINSLVSNIFGCLLLCSQNGIQLMSLSVPICFWNLLFEMLTMAKDRFPQGFVLFAILCIIRSVVLFFW